MNLDFLKTIFSKVGPLEWWQALIIVFVIIVTIFVGKYWQNVIGWFGTWFTGNKRSCSDCIMIIFGKREIYETKKRELDKTLKRQMNFAEQKLLTLQSKMINYYSDKLYASTSLDVVNDNQIVEFRMFSHLIHTTLHILIKDEIRRSFKENGFDDLTDSEFNTYLKDKHSTLFSVLKQQIVNLYPPPGSKMIIPMDSVNKYLNSIKDDIREMVSEIFIEAKEIKLDDLKKLETLKKSFTKDMENFVTKHEN